MADRMPPPGSGHGVAIVIAPDKGDGGKMPPPGGKVGPEDSGKASPDDAGVIRAAMHCIDCENYSPDTGSCAKVEGSFEPDDACLKYFEPVQDDESNEAPDADDQGGAQPQGGDGGGY